MNCIELSIEDIRDECVAWAKKIKNEFQPDLIVYIARGGYLIGKAFQEVFNCRMIEAAAERSGNKLKEFLAPVLSHLPKKLLDIVRNVEMKSGVHRQHAERSVEFHDSDETDRNAVERILIVDDAVDTGYSLKAVADKVKERYPDVEIKLAALNVWRQSESVVRCDFYKYQDTILRTPMSKDSKEYKLFMKLYQEQK